MLKARSHTERPEQIRVERNLNRRHLSPSMTKLKCVDLTLLPFSLLSFPFHAFIFSSALHTPFRVFLQVFAVLDVHGAMHARFLCLVQEKFIIARGHGSRGRGIIAQFILTYRFNSIALRGPLSIAQSGNVYAVYFSFERQAYYAFSLFS